MDERYVKARFLARGIKTTYWSAFQTDRNIVGMAFGRRVARGETLDEPAVIIYVARKAPARFLPPSRHLPRRMFVGGDHIEVDVVETGPIYPLSFTAGERPAPSGISIGNAAEPSAGTLGGLVLDNTNSGKGQKSPV